MRTADVAWRPLLIPTGVVAAVLVLTSGRYGYHRDELYFLRAGKELAWGYPDQPPLTPLLARVISAIAPESLIALRLPSAIAAGLVVLLTGLTARELGAGRVAQVLAASCMAAAALLLGVGHLLSTSTFDLLAWTGLTWLVVRALQRDDARIWLWVGVLAGIGLLNKSLVAFLIVALLLGLLVVGPRHHLRSGWFWLGAAIALVIWFPHLVWQADNGWPQLELSRAIAAGSSGTSEPWQLFIPFQLVLISPVLAPVWIAGLVRTFRDTALRRVRAIGCAYVILLGVFLLTGGKPYYLGGLYPVLLAAGAQPAVDWVQRRRERDTRWPLGTAIAISAAVSALLMLPLVPVSALHATPIPEINYDAGETVGWPRFVDTVAGVYDDLPPTERDNAVLLTGNYGEAGALDRFGPEHGLPQAYSGHNAYAEWGPPPDTATTVVAVGIDGARLGQWFGEVEAVARIDNGVDLDNEEQGATVRVCRDPRVSWSELWPEITHLG
jgi:Dolichyl-phosphate-mannose-protein mannosyltransferase